MADADEDDLYAAMDWLHTIRTSVGKAQMDAPTCVRNYKSLANMERAFRSRRPWATVWLNLETAVDRSMLAKDL